MEFISTYSQDNYWKFNEIPKNSKWIHENLIEIQRIQKDSMKFKLMFETTNF